MCTHYFLESRMEPLSKHIMVNIRTVKTLSVKFLCDTRWNSDISPSSRPFDKKLAYTFHKYRTSPTVDIIFDYINFRNQFQVPVYCGETLEYSNEWMSTFRGVLDSCGFGRHVWLYKK